MNTENLLIKNRIFKVEKIHPIFFLLIGIVVLAGCFFFISILAGEIALLVAGWIIIYIVYIFESKIKITDLFIHINKHKFLFIFTIIMSMLIMYESVIIGGLLFLTLIWGYNNKKDTKLINRLKNFKQHKMRFAFSILIVLVSATMIFLHFKEAKQQAFIKNYPEPVIAVISSQKKQAANKQYKLEFSVKNHTDVKVNGDKINSKDNLFSKVIDLETLQTKITIDAKNEYKSAQKIFSINREETSEEAQRMIEAAKAREKQILKAQAEAMAAEERKYQSLTDTFCSARSKDAIYANLDDFAKLLEDGHATIHNVLMEAPLRASCIRIAKLCSKRWSETECQNIAERKIWIGMEANQLMLSWRVPKDKNNTVGAWGMLSQWVYDDFGPYVYLEGSSKEDLIVTSWQD